MTPMLYGTRPAQEDTAGSRTNWALTRHRRFTVSAASTSVALIILRAVDLAHLAASQPRIASPISRSGCVARPRSLPLDLKVILDLRHSFNLTRECLRMCFLFGRLHDTAQADDAPLRVDVNAREIGDAVGR